MDYRLERVTSESHFRKKVISAAQKVMGSLGEHFKLQCLVSAPGQRGWQNLRGVYSTWLANRRKKKRKTWAVPTSELVCRHRGKVLVRNLLRAGLLFDSPALDIACLFFLNILVTQ